jgi:stringent starvation protein B
MMPSKKSLLEAALDQPSDRVGTSMVLVDVNHPLCRIAEPFLESADEDGLVWFRYSYRFNTPIEITDRGVEATLNKGGTNHSTFVPWGAVLSIVEESTRTQVLWSPEQVEPGQPKPAETPKKGFHLRLVTDDEPS